MTTRVFAFGIGLASAAAEQAQQVPGQLRSMPPAALRVARSVLAAGRSRYDELAEHGRQVLDGAAERRAGPAGGHPTPAGPARPAARTVPPPGGTSPVRLPPQVAAEVAARPPGALLDHSDLPLDDFDHLTLPQLRGRLRRLDLAGLAQLRDYERAHADRLPVITMLENRITALVEGPATGRTAGSRTPTGRATNSRATTTQATNGRAGTSRTANGRTANGRTANGRAGTSRTATSRTGGRQR